MYQRELRATGEACGLCALANNAYSKRWYSGTREMDVSEAIDEIARVLHGPWLR